MCDKSMVNFVAISVASWLIDWASLSFFFREISRDMVLSFCWKSTPWHRHLILRAILQIASVTFGLSSDLIPISKKWISTKSLNGWLLCFRRRALPISRCMISTRDAEIRGVKTAEQSGQSVPSSMVLIDMTASNQIGIDSFSCGLYPSLLKSMLFQCACSISGSLLICWISSIVDLCFLAMVLLERLMGQDCRIVGHQRSTM